MDIIKDRRTITFKKGDSPKITDVSHIITPNETTFIKDSSGNLLVSVVKIFDNTKAVYDFFNSFNIKPIMRGGGNLANNIYHQAVSIGFNNRSALRGYNCTASKPYLANKNIINLLAKIISDKIVGFEMGPRVDSGPGYWGSYYRAGVLNKTSQTGMSYHFDPDDSMPSSCLYITSNNISGGELVIPELDIAITPRDGYSIAFLSSELLHGVTEWSGPEDSNRFSLVFYSPNRLICESDRDKELAHSNTWSTNRLHDFKNASQIDQRNKLLSKMKNKYKNKI